MGGNLSGKKISSLIERYSGKNERERRAYEEPEQGRAFNQDLISSSIEKATKNFKYGDFTYTYYRFIDKMHTEPKTWGELFEFLNYLETEVKINKVIASFTKENK